MAASAHAAGFPRAPISASTSAPAINGAVWSPCSQPPDEIDLGTLPGVKDCQLPGDRLPLIVISHGRTGSFVVHHDFAEDTDATGFDP